MKTYLPFAPGQEGRPRFYLPAGLAFLSGGEESIIKPATYIQKVCRAILGAASVSAAQEGGPNGSEWRSEISSFLEAYTAAWTRHDAEGLATFFSPDADRIMGNQPQVVGREAIGGWWKAYFSRLDDGRKGSFESLSLRAFGPGVFLENVR